MARLAMIAGFGGRRTTAPPALLAVALLSLAACVPRLPSPAPPAQVPPGPTVETPPPPVPSAPSKTRVALLVPLSGSNAALGGALLEAAQLAVFDTADDRFELLPRDTKGTAQGALSAARIALADGATLILGPLFREEAAAIRPVAQNAGVEVLTFSSDPSLAGGTTYVMGQTPVDQVRRIVGYARAQGMTRFAALLPNGAYGDAVAGALGPATQAAGVPPARVERYDPRITDVAEPLRALAGDPAAGPPPFDALLLAEGGNNLRVIAPQLPLSATGQRTYKLLGTGLWDDPTLGRETVLVGGWYAAPDPQARADFEQRFQAAYGHKPLRIATLAYDATALAAVLARSAGSAQRPYDAATLTNASGFAGADGIFRLRPEGLVERGLAVLEVTPTGNRVLDPAPKSFEALGF